MQRGHWCFVWFVGAGLLWSPVAASLAGEVESPLSAVEFGRQIFEHNFSQPASWKGSQPLGAGGDGLGPQFNDVSCVACHKQGGTGGGGPASKNARVLSFLPANGITSAKMDLVVRRAADFHPDLSAARRSTPLQSFRLPQPDDRRSYEALLADLFDQLGLAVDQSVPQRRAIGEAVFEISQRNTTAMWGDGAIDSFRQQEGNSIRRHFIEEQNRKFPWLSGRVPRDVQNQEAWFGWRGQIASLHEFNLGACATEMGLTVSGMPQHRSGVDGLKQPELRLDLTDEQTLALTAFVASLPAPRQILPTDATAVERVAWGEQIFNNCDCNACHCRDLGWLTGIFSDLALHDMGPDLCDMLKANPEFLEGEVIPSQAKLTIGYYCSLVGAGAGVSSPKVKPTNCDCEWKTPPLWGCADTAPYLHDGRARTLDEAVLWHAGEAEVSRKAYQLLLPAERSALIDFLQTLRAPQDATSPAGPQVAMRSPALQTSTPDAGRVPAADAAAADGAPIIPVAAVAAQAVMPAGLQDAAAPPAEPALIAPLALTNLELLCLELRPGTVDLDRARSLSRQLAPELPEPGAADYALALFLERSLQHTAAITEFRKISKLRGNYAQRARQALILDDIRRHEIGSVVAALESMASDLAADATMTAHDAAEGAQWMGVILGWLSGPAGIDTARYHPEQTLARVTATLPAQFQPFVAAGAQQVQTEWDSLQAERLVLSGVEAAQQQASQHQLTEKRDDVIARQDVVQQSQADATSTAESKLAQIDQQLVDLEKQYAERDAVEQTLAARMASLQTRSTVTAVSATQVNGQDPRSASFANSLRSQLVDLNNELVLLGKQREPNQTQMRIIVIKAQQLAAQRSAAVAEYVRTTGKAAQELQSLSKWQDRFEKQAAKLGDASGNQSRRVQQLDRRIRNLTTYTRFDPEQEAQLMLTRYRAREE